MSGLPPPGICHTVATVRVRTSITEMLPSPRFEAYSHLESRLKYNP